jgi:DNA-binding protein Fis
MALGLRLAELRQKRTLPNDVGKHVKNINSALLGKHVCKLYDMLKWLEASILAQLRTEMARLNGYPSQIGAVESAAYACGQVDELVQYFLL